MLFVAASRTASFDSGGAQRIMRFLYDAWCRCYALSLSWGVSIPTVGSLTTITEQRLHRQEVSLSTALQWTILTRADNRA